jgi:glutathionyl-hydroquinone reductase
MGSLVTKGGVNVVNKDFQLSTVDIVQDPSAPEAFVNGIMEGVEWIWDNGVLKATHAQEVEQFETEIKEAYSPEMQMKAFKDFLSKL